MISIMSDEYFRKQNEKERKYSKVDSVVRIGTVAMHVNRNGDFWISDATLKAFDNLRLEHGNFFETLILTGLDSPSGTEKTFALRNVKIQSYRGGYGMGAEIQFSCDDFIELRWIEPLKELDRVAS